MVFGAISPLCKLMRHIRGDPMKSYVEHANISVQSTDSITDFIQTAIPDFAVWRRWKSGEIEWTHIGTDTTYIALMCRPKIPHEDLHLYRHNTSAIGFNHIGIAVADVEGVRTRLLDAGYKTGFNSGETIDEEFRKSVYFRDPDGREYEFVEYLTEDAADRNSYDD